MMLVLDKTQVEQPADAILDLERGTWTCTAHGTVMTISSQKDCGPCADSVAVPDTVPRWLDADWVG